MVLTKLTDIEKVLSESGSLTKTLQEMTKLTSIIIDQHVLTHTHTHTHTHVVICSILPFFKRTILQTSYVMNTNRFCAIPLKDTRARKLYLVMRLSTGVVLR